MIPPMFPISDDNERGHGPAFVSLAFIALNVFVFLVLQGAGRPRRAPSSPTATRRARGDHDRHRPDEPQAITVDGQTVPIPQEPGPSPI